MKHNLYLNFEEETKENKAQQGIQKEEPESFYDKVLEERSPLEPPEAATEIVAKNKLKLSEVPDESKKHSEPEKHYSHEEVLISATEYFNNDALAANVWMNKYALKDSEGKFYELNPK